MHAFNEAVKPLKPAEQIDQRERLFPFPPSHMLAGHHQSCFVKALLAAMVWTTVVILPLVLLIRAEACFLPYFNATVTLLQRSAAGFGLIGLWLFWPLIVKERHLSVFWRDLFRSLGYQSSLNP